MRRLYPISIFIFIILNYSCSSSESISEELSAEIKSDNYFPLQKNNYWIYNVESENSTTDSLWVQKDSLIEGEIFYQPNSVKKSGFFSNLLANSLIVKSKSKVFINGIINNLIPGLDIPINNMVLIDTKSPIGNEMYMNSGMSTYEFDKYIFHAEYDISTKTEAVLSDYTLFDNTYHNVIKTSLTVKLKGILTTNVNGYEVTIPVMKDQDVIISTQYFAPGIGLIYNETAMSYKLSNLNQVETNLPFPSAYSEVVTQSINKHSILN